MLPLKRREAGAVAEAAECYHRHLPSFGFGGMGASGAGAGVEGCGCGCSRVMKGGVAVFTASGPGLGLGQL